jgi:hypothetical protein
MLESSGSTLDDDRVLMVRIDCTHCGSRYDLVVEYAPLECGVCHESLVPTDLAELDVLA